MVTCVPVVRLQVLCLYELCLAATVAARRTGRRQVHSCNTAALQFAPTHLQQLWQAATPTMCPSLRVAQSHLPLHARLQLAQLNQATADARVMGDLLQQLAQQQRQLQAQLDAAKQEAAWAEEAAKKRVSCFSRLFGSACLFVVCYHVLTGSAWLLVQ
jgi:outer membrane murein-binding lipoprotein Lpp